MTFLADENFPRPAIHALLYPTADFQVMRGGKAGGESSLRVGPTRSALRKAGGGKGEALFPHLPSHADAPLMPAARVPPEVVMWLALVTRLAASGFVWAAMGRVSNRFVKSGFGGGYFGMTRYEVVGAIRDAARTLRTNRLSIQGFRQQSGIAQSAVLRHFDSWSEACRAAGVSSGPTTENLVPRPRVTEKACVEEMRRVAGLLGQRRLSTSEFDTHAAFTRKPVINRFGSWQKALEKAGLEACEKAMLDKPLSVGECVNELLRVARVLSTPTLTRSAFDSISALSSYRVVRVCGSWVVALSKAGLEPSPNLRTTVPIEELAAKFLDVTIELKRIPTLVQLVNRSEHAADTYSRSRGGYRAFRRAAIEHIVAKKIRIPHGIRSLLEADLAASRHTLVTDSSTRVDATESIEFVPPACADLVTLSMNRLPKNMTPRRVAHIEFENVCAKAFKILGFDVTPLGQGRGRQADLIAIANREHYGVIVDAKARAEGFALGTEDRTFLEYVTRHSAELRAKGVERSYLAVVSSSFRIADVTTLRNTIVGSINGFVFLTARALLRMVNDKIRPGDRFSLGGIEQVFFKNGIEEA